MTKDTLLGKSLDELTAIASALGMPSFTGKQMAEWVYKHHVTSISEMTNIAAKNKSILMEHFEVGRAAPVKSQVSKDGTVKYLFKTSQNNLIESVYIPEDDRATLCISSQIGCKMHCTFCMTGKQGFNGQLSVAEILNQFYSIPETDLLTNIVFMGMGEPLDNLSNVMKTLEILTAPYGKNWSSKRITVSTIGLIPGLKTFLESSDCHLAISVHSPFPEERLQLMPVQKPHPLDKILAEIKKYDFSRQRRVSFEYILFDGLNDTPQHAKELVRLLKNIPCRVNLIRFHSIPGVNLTSANTATLERFKNDLNKQGITTTIRKSRGEDIFAACGMLSSLTHSSHP